MAMDRDVVIVKGLHIEPGDRVLLTVGESVSADMMQEMQDLLRDRLPDVHFTIIHGPVEVAVQKEDHG